MAGAMPSTAFEPTDIWRSYGLKRMLRPFATTLTFAASSRFRENGSI